MSFVHAGPVAAARVAAGAADRTTAVAGAALSEARVRVDRLLVDLSPAELARILRAGGGDAGLAAGAPGVGGHAVAKAPGAAAVPTASAATPPPRTASAPAAPAGPLTRLLTWIEALAVLDYLLVVAPRGRRRTRQGRAS